MKLLQALLNLLYPPKCPFCGRLLERGEDGLCACCQRELPWADQADRKKVDFCDACLSPLWYRDKVPDAVRRYKFGGASGYAHILGTLMAQSLADQWNEPVDLVTWAPLSAKRLRKRGYDQAELLARQVGEAAGLPVEPTLVKARQNKTQSQLADDAQRRANVVGVYECLPSLDLTGKRVVLVDDIVTSGATLSECASCLRVAGAESVVALTLALAR